MVGKIEVSEVQIEFVPARNGLVAFASASINNCIRVANIALYTSPKSPLGYRCVFPTKRLMSGREVSCFYPFRSEAEQIITKAIVSRYVELMDNFNHVKS